MFKTGITFLSQPYPINFSLFKKLALTGSFSLFVALFLLLFQPFGLSDAFTFQALVPVTLGYGAVCGFVMAFNFFVLMSLLPSLFREQDWTIGRQILWTSWHLLTIGMANAVYSNYLGISTLSFVQVTVSSLQVLAVGIIPVTGLVALDYIRLLRNHLKKAAEINERLESKPAHNKSVVLTDDNNRQRLRLTLRDLLFISSADNYVSVTYRSDDMIRRILLRGTLKRFARQISHPQVVRCHRSYIVNLEQVINLDGNAQGYLLRLRGTDRKIPVSRTYAKEVIRRIEQL